jgi:hypothetical protein
MKTRSLSVLTLTALAPSLALADLNTEILADNPVAYWRLDDASSPALDATVNVNNADAFDAVTLGEPSLFLNDNNDAARTSGNGRLLSLPFEKIDGGGFTVEFWIKLHSAPGGFHNLVGDGEGGLDFSLMVYTTAAGNVRAHAQTAAGWSGLDSTEKLIVDAVHHVVSTWDAGTGEMNLYLDGVRTTANSVGATPLPNIGPAVNTDNAIYIGKDDREAGPDATFDEVAIYNYALSAERVAAHYAEVDLPDPPDPPEKPEPFAVPVGDSTLIADLDYSDTFTIGATAPGAARQAYAAQGFPLPAGVEIVEDSHGNASASWPGNAWSIATDTAINPGGFGYPGSSGGGSDTGITQRGGGGDWGIPYGQRDVFVLQSDFVQLADRVDFTIGDTPGTIGGGGNISVFFRTTNHPSFPEIGIYNPGIGERDSGLTSEIAADNLWQNYAVYVDVPNQVLAFYVNEEPRGSVDLTTFEGGAFAGILNNAFVGIGGAGNDRLWSDNFQVGSTAVQPPDVPDPPEPAMPFGVTVGNSTLIGTLDYGDTFTIGPNSPITERQTYPVQAFPLELNEDTVEDSHGNPAQFWGLINWSIATDAAVNPGATGYPGSSGAGTDEGFTQRGGGGDWSIPYGLRDVFVVQVDSVQTADRVDLTVGGTPNDIFGGDNISVFFRSTGAATEIGLFNAGIGETDTGLTSEIEVNNLWQNYALKVDIPNDTIEVFVNEVSRGVLDLTTIAAGAYAGILNNGFVGVGGAGNDRLWTDNFQVGAPGSANPGAGPALTAVGFDGAAISLGWDSRPQTDYKVEISFDLENWLELINPVASGGGSTSINQDISGILEAVQPRPSAAYFRVTDNNL